MIYFMEIKWLKSVNHQSDNRRDVVDCVQQGIHQSFDHVDHLQALNFVSNMNFRTNICIFLYSAFMCNCLETNQIKGI